MGDLALVVWYIPLEGDVPLLEVDVSLSRCDVTALVEGVACPISRAQEKVLHKC